MTITVVVTVNDKNEINLMIFFTLSQQMWAARKIWVGRAPFRKMPEAGLKIAQKGLKNTFLSKFCRGT